MKIFFQYLEEIINKLFIVATPIGNMDDISKRAIDVLNDSIVIYCEDTKHTKLFLNKLGINKELRSLHKFNEKEQVDSVLKALEKGNVSFVSDAGTPTISDPGQKLVKAAKDKGIEVVPIPGANAITTMLSASGLEFDSFSFIGFLDKTETRIVKQLSDHKTDVVVFYESPNRINKTLNYINKNFGDVEVVVARELTKKFEEIVKDKVSNLTEREFKGEIVVAVKFEKQENKNELKELVQTLKKEDLSDRSIINIITKTTSFKKNDIYELLKDKNE